MLPPATLVPVQPALRSASIIPRIPGRFLRQVAATVILACLVLVPELRAETIPEIETSLSQQSSRFKIGTLALFAYGTAGLGVDNNVFLTHSNRKIGLFGFLVPGLRAKRDEDNNHISLQIDYQGRARRYVGEGNVARASYMEHQFALQAIWKQAPTLAWEFSDAAAYLIDPVNASVPRAERFENSFLTKATWQTRTTEFNFTGNFDVLRFSRNVFRSQDYDNVGLGARAIYHDIGPKANLLGDYLMAYYNLRDKSRSDFLVHYLLLGAATPLGENKGWVYELKIGAALIQVVANRAANPGSDQMTSMAVAASARWSKADPDTYFSFTLKNGIEPSTTGGVTFSNIYSAQAEGQYVFNRSFRAGGRIAQQWIEEIGSSRDSARLLLLGTVTYFYAENLSFFGRLEYRHRFAHFRFDRYDDLRAMGGATYVF